MTKIKLYCPVCGPTGNRPFHTIFGTFLCPMCKWKGRKTDMWQPNREYREVPEECWKNIQRSKKLKEILV